MRYHARHICLIWHAPSASATDELHEKILHIFGRDITGLANFYTPLPVVDDIKRNGINTVGTSEFFSAIEDRIHLLNPKAFDKVLGLTDILIDGYADDDQIFLRYFTAKLHELGNFTAAGAAEGSKEVNQYHLAVIVCQHIQKLISMDRLQASGIGFLVCRASSGSRNKHRQRKHQTDQKTKTAAKQKRSCNVRHQKLLGVPYGYGEWFSPPNFFSFTENR